MASFTIDGITLEYPRPIPGDPDEIKSWEYGRYPKVVARVPLSSGSTFEVYAHAERWNKTDILVRWEGDDRRPHTAWIPAGGVRRASDSEWDVWEYRRCPPKLRGVRWGARLPGFLPG